MRVALSIFLWVGFYLNGIGLYSAYAQTSAPPSSTPPSAYEFYKPSKFKSVELSPNGQLLAYTIQTADRFCLNKSGAMIKQEKAKCKDKYRELRVVHKVFVYDLQAKKILENFSVPENFRVDWLDWGNNERLLVAIRRPLTIGRSQRYITFGGAKIISINITKNDPVILFDNQKYVSRENKYLTRVTNFLRSDPNHIIMPARRTGDLDLWKVNINNGDAELIATGKEKTFHWYTNKAGEPTLRFDCSGYRCRKIKVYKPGDGDKWTLFKTFKVKPDDEEHEYDFWPVAPTNNPDQIYVLSNEETDPRRSIKIYDLKTESYIKTVYEHPKYDVSNVLTNAKTGEYAGVYYYDDRLKFDFLDPTLQKHFDAINRYFGNVENVDFAGYSSDGAKIILYVSSPNNPGEYHTYDFNEKRVDFLISRKPGLRGKLTSQTDLLDIPMRDGTVIRGYHTYPKSGAGPHVPLLIIPHGGPEVRDYHGYEANVQYFVSRGYQTIQMNYRGSSGYGRKYAEAGYGEWGGLMQDDVTDSIKYLYDNNLASADNACIVGYSYGGYVALYAAMSTPELFKCVVSGGGVSDLLLDLKQTRGDHGSDSDTYEYWLESIGNPKTEKDKLKAASPVNFAEKFEDPVLLIHGEYDSIVDIDQSKAMRRALKQAGKSVEFIELEDEGHYGWAVDTHVLYLETIENFLAQHLK